MEKTDKIISQLYRASERVPVESYREWALDQLHEILDFDAALWGSGTLDSPKFHSRVLIGLPMDYIQAAEDTKAINPFFGALVKNIGKTVCLSEVITDRKLTGSDIYQQCFEPYGIHRILSIIQADPRTGLHSLFSFYRFDMRRKYNKDERRLVEQITGHLTEAASHAYFSHLFSGEEGNSLHCAAVCDHMGVFHEVQPEFVGMLHREYPDWSGGRLPFALPESGGIVEAEKLRITVEPLGELLCVHLREAGPLDQLTKREKAIVEAVSQGRSFKEIARNMGLAPSTISNHLYRVYRKLGITSRSALAQMVHGKRDD